MDQVKFVGASFSKIWSDIVCFHLMFQPVFTSYFELLSFVRLNIIFNFEVL